MATSSRQIKLGAFLMQTGHHIAAWRHPQAQADAGSNFRHYVELAKLAEAAKFDAVFLADSVGVRSSELASLSRTARSDHFEPFTLLSALAQSHAAHRADRHRLDHLRRAVPHRAPLRLARPPERGPRGLEHRDHLESRRGAELRPRGPHGARRALRPGARVPRRGDRPVGQLGRRRLRARRRQRPASSIRPSCMCWHHKGEHLSVRGPLHIARLGAGLAGDRAGRRLGGRAPARGRNGRADLRGAGHASNARAFYADIKSRMRKLRARARAPQDPAGRLHHRGRHGRRGEGDPRQARQDLVHYDSRDRLAVDRARATTPPASTPTARCPRCRPPTRARAGASCVIELARRENLTVRL
jgi:hypothetical protein